MRSTIGPHGLEQLRRSRTSARWIGTAVATELVERLLWLRRGQYEHSHFKHESIGYGVLGPDSAVGYGHDATPACADAEAAPIAILPRDTKPFHDSLETRFETSMKNLDLIRFLPYNPVELNFTPTSAMLDFELALSYVQLRQGGTEVLLEGTAALRDLASSRCNPIPAIRSLAKASESAVKRLL